jgi:ADP-ribosyl-[dinitrogen reductase] hydrolase
LLGLAVGDALGAPLKTLEANTLSRKHGRVTEMLGGGRQKLPAGAVTDKTQTVLAVAQSLIERDAFDPDDIAARLVAWLESNPSSIDNQTRQVLDRIRGVGTAGNKPSDWKSASLGVQRTIPATAGNAALVRCAPVALFDWQDAGERVEHARIQAEITHAHQDCQWSSAIASCFIAHAMTTQVRDAALDAALEECKNTPAHIRKRVTVAPSKSRSEVKSTGNVLDTLDVAIWALMNTYSFEDAVVEAVNLGGDADTAGALCGAMAGAFYGEADIPARWLEPLQHRDQLTGLADKLAARHGM